MSQMSSIRQKLGGYKLVKISNYNDISYMSMYEIQQGWGVPMSFWYYMNKRGKTVRKTVSGHWGLEINGVEMS